MSTATRGDPATSSTATSRLHLYARYAALVNQQEHALDEEDLEAFQELADSRDDLQKQIESLETPEPTDEHRSLREEAAKTLRSALAADGRVRSKLAVLRQHTLEGIRHMDDRGRGARRYIEQSAKRPGTVARVDVRF